MLEPRLNDSMLASNGARPPRDGCADNIRGAVFSVDICTGQDVCYEINRFARDSFFTISHKMELCKWVVDPSKLSYLMIYREFTEVTL